MVSLIRGIGPRCVNELPAAGWSLGSGGALSKSTILAQPGTAMLTVEFGNKEPKKKPNIHKRVRVSGSSNKMRNKERRIKQGEQGPP